jgi:hypothetical protein
VLGAGWLGGPTFVLIRSSACVSRVKSDELDLEDQNRHITKWCNYRHSFIQYTEMSIIFCP